MPDLVSIEVVGKVQAGSRVKKYHILENDSSKYSFQKQVNEASTAFGLGFSGVMSNLHTSIFPLFFEGRILVQRGGYPCIPSETLPSTCLPACPS